MVCLCIKLPASGTLDHYSHHILSLVRPTGLQYVKQNDM